MPRLWPQRCPRRLSMHLYGTQVSLVWFVSGPSWNLAVLTWPRSISVFQQREALGFGSRLNWYLFFSSLCQKLFYLHGSHFRPCRLELFSSRDGSSTRSAQQCRLDGSGLFWGYSNIISGSVYGLVLAQAGSTVSLLFVFKPACNRLFTMFSGLVSAFKTPQGSTFL